MSYLTDYFNVLNGWPSNSPEENSNEDTSESNSSSDEDIYKKDDSQISDDDSDEKSFYENKSYMKFVNEFSKKLPNDFMKNRKIGQNENHICKLIREDLIDEFISYVNQHNYPLNSNIEKSIYETNSLLTKNNPTLIEYASFFGSVQIIKYLYLNKVKLTPSLWIYGIHGDNPELINILEENHIKPNNNDFSECFKEAIKCHYIDTSNYIQNNFLNNSKSESDNFNILSYCFHYHNYSYFPNEINDNLVFYFACKYDYYTIVENLLKTKRIDLNEKHVLNYFFLFWSFFSNNFS